MNPTHVNDPLTVSYIVQEAGIVRYTGQGSRSLQTFVYNSRDERNDFLDMLDSQFSDEGYTLVHTHTVQVGVYDHVTKLYCKVA